MLADTTAEIVAEAFYAGWISHFGPPLRLTTDQDPQFESSLFLTLNLFLDISKIHTSPYHSAANSQVERFHWQLKAAIMARNTMEWTKVLPYALLHILTAWKDDLHATAAEMVYGPPLYFRVSSSY